MLINICFQCKSEFDHFFVIGLSELSQNVRCILCKGTYYPPVTPKPLVAEIKWKVRLFLKIAFSCENYFPMG